jgi:hypothetical protein
MSGQNYAILDAENVVNSYVQKHVVIFVYLNAVSQFCVQICATVTNAVLK